MLFAGHVTVLADGGRRVLLRNVKFSHNTLLHIVTAARTSRLGSLGLVTSQTGMRSVSGNINALLHGKSSTRYNP
jgi:hypothetical protein